MSFAKKGVGGYPFRCKTDIWKAVVFAVTIVSRPGGMCGSTLNRIHGGLNTCVGYLPKMPNSWPLASAVGSFAAYRNRTNQRKGLLKSVWGRFRGLSLGRRCQAYLLEGANMRVCALGTRSYFVLFDALALDTNKNLGANSSQNKFKVC